MVQKLFTLWKLSSASLLLSVLGLAMSPAQAACNGDVAVQVLGSGGPIVNPARASASYLLWVKGKARLLVDTGGGSFVRFGQAEARIEDLEAILLTHLHVDHAVDLPAYLKSGWFSARRRPLPLLGPSGAGEFPDLKDFVDSLIGPQGAFRYLQGYLPPEPGYFALQVQQIDHTLRRPQEVFKSDGLRILAIGVKHGPVPALGYRVDVAGRSIAFSGDQNGDNPAFAAMIRNVDLLVMDHAVPEDTDPVAANLHARPSEIARLAWEARVGRLLLSHIMPRSERRLTESQALIRKTYHGPLDVAQDLMCIELPSVQPEQMEQPESQKGTQ